MITPRTDRDQYHGQEGKWRLNSSLSGAFDLQRLVPSTCGQIQLLRICLHIKESKQEMFKDFRVTVIGLMAKISVLGGKKGINMDSGYCLEFSPSSTHDFGIQV